MKVVAQREYARRCLTTSMAKNRREICKNELYIFVWNGPAQECTVGYQHKVYITPKGKTKKGTKLSKAERKRNKKEKQGRKRLQEQSKGKKQKQAHTRRQKGVTPFLRKNEIPNFEYRNTRIGAIWQDARHSCHCHVITHLLNGGDRRWSSKQVL